MIVTNEPSRYGSWSIIRTGAFNCLVSTAPAAIKISANWTRRARRKPISFTAIEGVFSVAKARGLIIDYIVDR
jgi:hypothetical protein